MTTLQINLTPSAAAIMEGFKTLPVRALQAVAKAMDASNQLAVANIQQKHLTGKGPFPVEEHRLGVVTNRLRGSVNASPAKVQGQQVTSAIGSNVIYAAIHEAGGVIHHPAKSGSVKLRTDKSGNLFRQPGFPHLAMFARESHQRFKAVKYHADAYDIHMPARHPFATGLAECQPIYTRNISAGLIAALKASF